MYGRGTLMQFRSGHVDLEGAESMSADLDRLYNLLPAIYRVRDADQGWPLRGLLQVISEGHSSRSSAAGPISVRQ